MVEVLKALADENRVRLLNILLVSELCVCEIEGILELTQSNVSRHLNKLKSAKIIKSHKKSQWVYYEVEADFLAVHFDLIKYLKAVTFNNEICKKDLIRLKSSNISCNDIVTLK